MTFKTIINMFQAQNSPIIVFSIITLLSLVEVSKIPFNPWKLLGKGLKRITKSIGRAFNEDIYAQLNEIKDNQEKLDLKIDVVENNLKVFETKSEKKDLQDKRSRILRFYNECYRGIEHSREEFDNIIETYEEYERIIELRGYTNGKAENAYDYIMKKYKECESNHSFIQ